MFVLDVNRDYRPWLVERTRLFDAMNTWDGDIPTKKNGDMRRNARPSRLLERFGVPP